MASFELITSADLVEVLDDVVLLDSRPASDYWQGHIPGARPIDPSLFSVARTDASALARLQAQLAWSLSMLGIERGSRVVVTGAANEPNAARVAWALAYAGAGNIAVLDGGIKSWGNALTEQAKPIIPKNFEIDPQRQYLATADDVLTSTARGGKIIDVREENEYQGLRSNVGRKGRIPGARFWDTRKELLQDGRFNSAKKLRTEFTDLISEEEPVITYCVGGGRSARTFLALQLAGHKKAAVYPASWNEWGIDERFPVETR